MLRAEITILGAPEKVWGIFTQCEKWETWWGGVLKSAEWVEGGKMNWGIGGYSTILNIAPAKMVHYQLKGSFTSDTTYTFSPMQGGRATLVTVEKEYQGVSVGYSKQKEIEDELAGLKRLVERS